MALLKATNIEGSLNMGYNSISVEGCLISSLGISFSNSNNAIAVTATSTGTQTPTLKSNVIYIAVDPISLSSAENVTITPSTPKLAPPAYSVVIGTTPSSMSIGDVIIGGVNGSYGFFSKSALVNISTSGSTVSTGITLPTYCSGIIKITTANVSTLYGLNHIFSFKKSGDNVSYYVKTESMNTDVRSGYVSFSNNILRILNVNGSTSGYGGNVYITVWYWR